MTRLRKGGCSDISLQAFFAQERRRAFSGVGGRGGQAASRELGL